MSRPGNYGSGDGIRLQSGVRAALLLGAAVTALSGCGSGAGNGETSTHVPVYPNPSATVVATPILPTPTPADPLTQPAPRLADLSQGASWEYFTFPGNDEGGHVNPGSAPSGRKFISLVPAGSSLAVAAGFGNTDTTLPASLVRFTKTEGNSGSAPPTYRYDGTYRQDAATADVYLLRLPTGEMLDTPAKVLPGIWGAHTEIRSRFVVGGVVKAEYLLAVEAPDIIATRIGRKPVWLTRLSIKWFGPKGQGHILTSKLWFEPTSGSYSRSRSYDTRMVLEDLTLVEILDDEEINSYTVNR
jgi:hypothetical protein